MVELDGDASRFTAPPTARGYFKSCQLKINGLNVVARDFFLTEENFISREKISFL